MSRLNNLVRVEQSKRLFRGTCLFDMAQYLLFHALLMCRNLPTAHADQPRLQQSNVLQLFMKHSGD